MAALLVIGYVELNPDYSQESVNTEFRNIFNKEITDVKKGMRT